MSDAKHAGSTGAPNGRHQPLLATLVGDTDAFADRCWGLQPAVFRSPAGFEHLLSSTAVCDLLERATRRPHLRMVRDGITLSPQDYTTSVRMGGTMTPDVADVDRIADQFAAGATLVLQSLERIHSPLRHFAGTLQREISHPVQVNAYVSPPSAAALARHADRHEVFVVQLEGSKSWEVDDMGSFELGEGEVLYIPRGCAHAAATTDRHSLHLTVGVLTVTYGDVVRRAVRSVGRELDRPLPLGFAHESAGTAVSTAIDTAIRDTARRLLTTDSVATALAEQQRTRRGSASSDGLRRVFALAGLTDASLIRVHDDARVSHDGEQVVLTFGSRQLRMPAVAAPALHALTAAEFIAVEQLVGLDAKSRLVLARRLLREGAADPWQRHGPPHRGRGESVGDV